MNTTLSPQTPSFILSGQLGLPVKSVASTLELLESGATVPFIARYRKEVTGSLEETSITAIRDNYQKLLELAKRREAILGNLRETENLTDELTRQIMQAPTLAELEDIYLPYRPKRKTRASMAREKGLAPLAEAIFENRKISLDSFIAPEKNVENQNQALAGALDIVAEKISEDQEVRSSLRELFRKSAQIESKVVKKNQDNAEKYRDYFAWQEPAAKAPSHRILAMFRGDAENFLTLSIRPPEEDALALLNKRFVRSGPWQKAMIDAARDSYSRLLCPSLENELRTELKTRADEEAIAVFAANLRELLLAPPLGRKRVLALDPGYRTGAKTVCLDEFGKLLASDVIYPTHGGIRKQEAETIVRRLVKEHAIDAIAIGNGTAGRETEQFIKSLELGENIIVTLVNEDGASVYSASESARQEFPDYDITVRGAVSIGRRLQDPLAELVKIDPKAIGVGQYQHDVNQNELKKALDQTIESCVNQVGVELNSASIELLSHVAGVGPAMAANIVTFRNENGAFKSRKQLLKVPRLGPKAFEQCAGFLRISNAKNPLDGSAVHPERYDLVGRMASDLGLGVDQLLNSAELRSSIDISKYISDEVGIPTLKDILDELAKPGRDPREQFELFQFAANIQTIEDLRTGMTLPAIITNVTNFGAFADLGIKQNGLIHISQLADRFVKDPSEIVKVGQKVTARVIEIDIPRNRIALSLRKS